ncbi:MAG TPA: MBL fold metallo-hydrolase [Gemmatimonadaceae bacterium]|nr:MBL fold metallo-hydrolase [Gemmatimonadaceae bacterium]
MTGSCHLLRVNGRTIALDCGLFQGHRQATDEKNRRLPCPIESLDAVVLSHAHIDHSGRLPFLVREGYSKTIWATPATRDLSAIMLADSAHIQEKDAEFLARRGKQYVAPLYTMRDAVRVPELTVSVPYHKQFDVVPGVRATFVDAGHILGSASVVLDCTEGTTTKRLVFSADIGRVGLPIIRDPEVPTGADAVILESTYGDRLHESVADSRAELRRVVVETAARSGRILVPAFAVGRTQEVIYELHELLRAGEIPPIPIYIDSPLAIDATGVFASHPDVFDDKEQLVQKVAKLFDFPLVRYTRTVEESKAIAQLRGPVIVIAASGMAESGRILHHLAQGASDERNAILIVGFQAEHTLGRRIVEKQPVLKIFGEPVPLRARVEIINGYSAHADQKELVAWLDVLKSSSPKLGPIFLVHGEPGPQEALATVLRATGYSQIHAPTLGQRLTF